ncbi:hypothetical protein RFI_39382 [Reticulomyxa filosa]|uniref:Uncharacterized protein n=1 Tax=Reticulomyxa filosa TaxID=46433 RepID=X6L9T8_RETFI|nr:hypothetical protein RFI_39382 [Reticulomyxa filosa]|eukprot:ETN98135.1 hypothetical protein RFI_39382 [Reticulomyxa filosa]
MTLERHIKKTSIKKFEQHPPHLRLLEIFFLEKKYFFYDNRFKNDPKTTKNDPVLKKLNNVLQSSFFIFRKKKHFPKKHQLLEHNQIIKNTKIGPKKLFIEGNVNKDIISIFQIKKKRVVWSLFL